MTVTWEKLSRELYTKAPPGPRHSLLEQLGVGPFHQSCGLPTSPHYGPGWDFWNITLPGEGTLSKEFASQPEAAHLVKSLLESKDLAVEKLYCSPTNNLTPWKRQLLVQNPAKKVNLGVDPFSLGLWQAQLFKGDFNWTQLTEPHPNRVFRFHGAPYALSGASEVQQLAALMSSVVQLISESEGFLSPREVFSILSFELCLDCNVVVGTAQVRALRHLIGRMQELYAIETQDVPVFVLPSLRGFSRREPWNNLLRLSLMNVAARLGGADGFIALPFDVLSENETSRLSRNLDFVLGREAQLQQVMDPFAGSYAVETLTERLCEETWVVFQEMQAKGGVLNCLQSGWLQEQIRAHRTQQEESFLKGRQTLLGVNQHVLSRSLDPERPLPIAEQTRDLESWWLAWQGVEERCEVLSQVQRLPMQMLAEPFEQWQWQSDQWRNHNPEVAKIRFLVEPGFDLSKKVAAVRRTLSVLGLEGTERATRSPVCVVFAGDPQGDFVSKAQAELRQEQGVKLLLWGGEKAFQGFDHFVGDRADLPLLFNLIATAFEEVMP